MMDTNEIAVSKALFLIRPIPETGEGVMEYVQRLAKVNGYESGAAILSLLDTPMKDIVDRSHDDLEKVIHGHACSKTLRITCKADRPPILYEHSYRRLASARVCSCCLRESDVLSSQWSELLSISCPRHQVLLLDQCPMCSRRVHRLHSQYRCQCGLDFRDAESFPAPYWEARFYEIVAPWRTWGQLRCTAATIVRAEILAARVVRQLINCKHWKGNNWAPQRQTASKPWWLRTSDHRDIEEICSADMTLGDWTDPSVRASSTTLMEEWGEVAKQIGETASAGPSNLWQERASRRRVDLLEESLLKDWVTEWRKRLHMVKA
jgi:hypothetical protein